MTPVMVAAIRARLMIISNRPNSVALIWSLYDPACSVLEVARLSSGDGDSAGVEEQLMRRGKGAILALRYGVSSPDESIRLRSASLLARLGEDECDRVLLEALRQGERDSVGALAEQLLLTVWDRRKGPETNEGAVNLRKKLHAQRADEDPQKELALMLALYPAWASGYAARARRHLQEGELHLSTQDALTALLLEPDHFEAMVVLGRCFFKLGFTERALDCFERALLVNPRLRIELDAEMKAVRAGASMERERRLLERRMELQVF